MKILIVYGTTEGQTRKIARFMEEVLQNSGIKVTIADASEEPPPPTNYDAIIIGGSVHMQKYQSAMTHYIADYANDLNKMPGAFFSVSLAVMSDDKEERLAVKKISSDFLEQTGWKPQTISQIAGALKYTKYDFFKKFIMKRISKKEGHQTDTSQDYEYTDWDEVKKFAIEFAEEQLVSRV